MPLFNVYFESKTETGWEIFREKRGLERLEIPALFEDFNSEMRHFTLTKESDPVIWDGVSEIRFTVEKQ